MAAIDVDPGSEAVNVSRRLYWSEHLGVGQITNFYDEFGDETEDENIAVIAVAKIHDRCWVKIDLRAYPSDARQH